MTQVCPHGDHNVTHYLQNGGRHDDLILYRRFQKSHGFFCFSSKLFQLCSKIKLLPIVIPSAAYFVASVILLPFNTIFFANSPIFLKDTWVVNNLCFQHRHFKTLFFNPFVISSQSFWTCEKTSCIKSPAETCVASSGHFWNYLCILRTCLQCRRTE